ncbi:MAG: glucose-6-phosphate dehydrogenase assembly protein OpcA [Verrucomicrobia bacterium]|nr:glucose-6-phosphate dehydrogenase assembly protein OpcA [Verrucomicrobiota bacterium]MBU6445989.1 glucose-6-phosphate dehydrogenase assembly protein OpcA [Verrucomicrobiota bacterium]MDE3047688.1 glucose-6-phosphate dehydrogenase assembly protein OpcA [Verrucomicrobiota bacterium]
MTTQFLVEPERIESELLKLWDNLAKEKVRACLFNLIVFNQLSSRTDYIRNIVQKVSEKYPCRVLFISSDPGSAHSYLKTAVSVVGDGTIACDYIDIGYSGKEVEKVPFLLLPHIIPDLPTSLLWSEDPSVEHPLFQPLIKLTNRIIFDSESADSLLAFAQKNLALHQAGIHTADLNWARTEGWRDLIGSLFHSGERLEELQDVRLTYNAKTTESFCHLKVQSMYLLAWLASRLKWTFKKATQDLHFIFDKQRAEIQKTEWEKLGPGTVISVDLATRDNHLYNCARLPNQYHHVAIQISSPEKCELPYGYVLGKTATGQSLVKEIITQGTSQHYLEMLKKILELDRDQLC